MRILVDGLDLTGKTTLVQSLVETFASQGIPARANTFMLSDRHRLSRRLRRLPRVRQPDSALITAALLGPGYLLDSILVRRGAPDSGTVVIQDGYADRTAAFGMAGGPYLASCLALRWPGLFAAFDLAVYLHAPAEVRAARLATRDDADCGDIRSVQDTAFAETFTAMLVHGMGRRHRRLLVFDSSRHTPQELASAITGTLLPGAAAAPLQEPAGHGANGLAVRAA